MNPLSVTASITGLLTSAGEVSRILGPYISAAKETPQITAHVLAEVQSASIILSSVQKLTINLATIPPQRASLIQLDQIIAILTDGVLLFSELEVVVRSITPEDTGGVRLPLRARLAWARKESAFNALLARLQSFKSSMSLILVIINSESDRLAAQHQQDLSVNVNNLLESNHALTRRLMNLEDAFDVQSIVSKRQSLTTASGSQSTSTAGTFTKPDQPLSSPLLAVGISTFDFQDDLDNSRVYRRAQRDTADFSFRSSVARTNAWSVFSGLSLGEVSLISVIALPVYVEDLSNAEHYDFGTDARPKPTLIPARSARPILYDCMELHLQLTQIHGMSTLLDSDILDDPFTNIWGLLRTNSPYIMLLDSFGALSRKSWEWDSVTRENAVELFLQTCSEALGLSHNDLFTKDDLKGSDNSMGIKVMAVVSLVMERLTRMGTIAAVDLRSVLPNHIRESPTEMDLLVEEFLSTERTYLSQLQELADIRDWVKIHGNLGPNKFTEIFSPVTRLLNDHIQLIVLMEQNLLRPAKEQRWEKVFMSYQNCAEGDGVFLSNENAARIAITQYLTGKDRRQNEKETSMLTACLALLYSPSQRLPKYTAFIKDLMDDRALSYDQSEDFKSAYHHLQKALITVNDTIRDKEIQAAILDLRDRVDDWKNHRVDQFGKLILFETLNIKKESPSHTTTYQYHVYLFELILLCLREQPTRFSKGIPFIRPKVPLSPPNKKPGLLLKGRIFTNNMTDVVLLSKPGYYACQVFWKGDPGIENFQMLFPSESLMKKWAVALRGLIKTHERARATRRYLASHRTEDLKNPYPDCDTDEDDEVVPSYV